MTGKIQRLSGKDFKNWDVRAYCQTLLKLYDAQVHALTENGAAENADTQDQLLEALCSASQSVCEMKSRNLTDILLKVEFWKRLAPEPSAHPTPDETLMASIVYDLERLAETNAGSSGASEWSA